MTGDQADQSLGHAGPVRAAEGELVELTSVTGNRAPASQAGGARARREEPADHPGGCRPGPRGRRRRLRGIHELRAALIIHINDQGIGDEPMAPFGGVKNSGYGKFGGTAGIESFTEQRWVTIQHSGRPAYLRSRRTPNNTLSGRFGRVPGRLADHAGLALRRSRRHGPGWRCSPRRCPVACRSRITAPRASCSRAVDSPCAGPVHRVSRLKLVG